MIEVDEKSIEINDLKKKHIEYLSTSIFCFILLLGCFIMIQSKQFNIKRNQLVTIKQLVVNSELIKKKSKGENQSKWIEFSCKNNLSTYKIADFDYKANNIEKILNEIKIGDTISVKILRKQLVYYDTYNALQIHSLIKKDIEYLDLKTRNILDKKNLEFSFYFLFIFTIISGSISYYYSLKRKVVYEIEPNYIIIPISLILFLIVLFYYT